MRLGFCHGPLDPAELPEAVVILLSATVIGLPGAHFGYSPSAAFLASIIAASRAFILL